MRLIVLLGTIAALSGFNCFLLDNQNTTKIDHSMTGHTTMSPPTKIDQNTTDKTSTDQNNTDSGVIIKVWSSTKYYFHYYHIARPYDPPPPPPKNIGSLSVCLSVCYQLAKQFITQKLLGLF